MLETKNWIYQQNEIKVFYFTINPVSHARRQKKHTWNKKRVYQQKKIFCFTINPVSQVRKQKLIFSIKFGTFIVYLDWVLPNLHCLVYSADVFGYINTSFSRMINLMTNLRFNFSGKPRKPSFFNTTFWIRSESMYCQQTTTSGVSENISYQWNDNRWSMGLNVLRKYVFQSYTYPRVRPSGKPQISAWLTVDSSIIAAATSNTKEQKREQYFFLLHQNIDPGWT